jgi:hypothetical protein
MSVRVSPALTLTTTSTTTTLPSFAQSFHTTAATTAFNMRPTAPTRDAHHHHHAMPSIASLSASAEQHELPAGVRKRPRRGSRGVDPSGSE